MSRYPSRGRPGLLGMAPRHQRPGLLNPSMSRTRPQHFSQFEHQPNFRQKPGLLGSAPNRYKKPLQQPGPKYRREQHHPQQEIEYSYAQQEDEYHDDDRDYELPNRAPPPPQKVDRLTPQVHKLMTNLGLSKADMEELSRLPEKELSSNNLAHAIQNIRNKKSRPDVPSPDLRQVISGSRQETQDLTRHSYKSRHHSPVTDTMYDPSEPTTDEYSDQQDRYEEENEYGEETTDAFTTFQQKWYSEAKKSNERNDQPPSILRGSRGPAAKTTRWEREDHGQEEAQQRRPQMQRRPSPPPTMRTPPMPRRSSPVPRRMSISPRRMSPPLQRRMSPPPQRRLSPPRGRQNVQGLHHQRGGLLGDPHAPSTQELDMLAATISKGRRSPSPVILPPKRFHPPPEHHFPEPQKFQRFQEPVMQREQQPPPLMAQFTKPPQNPSPLEAQMRAMQVLQSETQPGKGPKKHFHSKAEAQEEANKMRRAEGRVLYLRYQAGGMGIICEQELVQLAQPFEKVTNILFVAPKNLKTGWYQAFVELAQFDGAAAMLEQYMSRPPTVKDIPIQVQRSNHQTLQLRENQMNRDFDKLLEKDNYKRKKTRSPNRSKGRPQDRSKKPRTDNRDGKSRTPKGLDNKKDAAKLNKQKPENLKESNKNNQKSKDINEKPTETVSKDSKLDSESSDAHSESFRLVDEVIEKMDEEIILKKEKEEGASQSNGKVEKEKETERATENIKKEIDSELKQEQKTKKQTLNEERLKIIEENIEQAINMSEDLLKTVKQESTQSVISEVLEYLADSLSQIKEIEKD